MTSPKTLARVSLAVDQYKYSRTIRDQAITDALEDGWSLADVAEASHLSMSNLRKIRDAVRALGKAKGDQ